jgi:hypothetical protein
MEVNTWNGKNSLQLTIRDIKATNQGYEFNGSSKEVASQN